MGATYYDNTQYLVVKFCKFHLFKIHLFPIYAFQSMYFWSKIKKILQRPGETLYMWNVVLHLFCLHLSLEIINYMKSFDECLGSRGSKNSSDSGFSDVAKSRYKWIMNYLWNRCLGPLKQFAISQIMFSTIQISLS